MQASRLLVIPLLGISFLCNGSNLPLQIPPDLQTNSKFQELVFVPPTYEKAALQLMLTDANRTAHQLNLLENLPIRQTDLVGFHVSPPRLVERVQTIGTISTSNYLYAPFAGRGFVVVRQGLEQEEARLRADYVWQTNRMDMEAAYRDAVQILRNADIAVNVLNDNCHFRITTCIPEGQTSHFVPIYWVTWSENNPGPLSSGASVELVEPTKTILQLQVFGSQYILRKPVLVTSTNLLSQTNAPARSNVPDGKK